MERHRSTSWLVAWNEYLRNAVVQVSQLSHNRHSNYMDLAIQSFIASKFTSREQVPLFSTSNMISIWKCGELKTTVKIQTDKFMGTISHKVPSASQLSRAMRPLSSSSSFSSPLSQLYFSILWPWVKSKLEFRTARTLVFWQYLGCIWKQSCSSECLCKWADGMELPPKILWSGDPLQQSPYPWPNALSLFHLMSFYLSKFNCLQYRYDVRSHIESTHLKCIHFSISWANWLILNPFLLSLLIIPTVLIPSKSLSSLCNFF